MDEHESAVVKAVLLLHEQVQNLWKASPGFRAAAPSLSAPLREIERLYACLNSR